MQYAVRLSNGTLLVITALATLDWALQKLRPRRFVCLFVVSNAERFNEQILESGIVRRLLTAGCDYWVLFGSESEKAHDDLDWCLDECGATDVTTTWHDDEPAEEVVDFAVTTSKLDTKRMGLAAILDDGVDADGQIEKYLRKMEVMQQLPDR